MSEKIKTVEDLIATLRRYPCASSIIFTYEGVERVLEESWFYTAEDGSILVDVEDGPCGLMWDGKLRSVQ